MWKRMMISLVSGGAGGDLLMCLSWGCGCELGCCFTVRCKIQNHVFGLLASRNLSHLRGTLICDPATASPVFMFHNPQQGKIPKNIIDHETERIDRMQYISKRVYTRHTIHKTTINIQHITNNTTKKLTFKQNNLSHSF
jgi:hypothetical protein